MIISKCVCVWMLHDILKNIIGYQVTFHIKIKLNIQCLWRTSTNLNTSKIYSAFLFFPSINFKFFLTHDFIFFDIFINFSKLFFHFFFCEKNVQTILLTTKPTWCVWDTQTHKMFNWTKKGNKNVDILRV